MPEKIRKNFNYNYPHPQEPRHASFKFAPRKLEKDTPLRIVSYNIRFSRKIHEAIELLSQNENLNKADVLCLQEMDLEGVERIAQALQFNYVYYPAVFHPYHGKDFGNAILAKWPIIKDRKIILPKVPRQRLQRIAVSVTVVCDNKEITILCIHMKVFMLPRDRSQQIASLLKEIPPSTEHCVIAGDFNTITDRDRKAIRQSFQEENFRLSNENVGWTHRHWTLFNKRNFVDHIYVKGLEIIEVGKVENSKASDHFPIWVELK